jgi:hypothetical protein
MERHSEIAEELFISRNIASDAALNLSRRRPPTIPTRSHDEASRTPPVSERRLMQITVNVRVTDSPDKLVTVPAQDHARGDGRARRAGGVLRSCT